MCRKVCCLRQINTTGNLRMADMCDLPAGRTSIAVIARSKATKQSIVRLARYGLLRGACDRARIRSTRWLAMMVFKQ